jgi:hypothetical protein
LAGYDASVSFGVTAPNSTPDEIIDKINEAIIAALADPKIKPRPGDLDDPVMAGSPADFGKFIAEETEKWASPIKAGGVSMDCRERNFQIPPFSGIEKQRKNVSICFWRDAFARAEEFGCVAKPCDRRRQI